MKLTLWLLGREVLALDVQPSTTQQEPEPGPPFGFSGSGGGETEIAGTWVASEV